MAKVNFNNLDQQFSFVLEHYAVYKGSTVEATNLQFWSWVTKLNHDVEFSGTNMAFDAGDLPFGGDDMMNVGGLSFLGDFNSVSGFASGGDDTITVEADTSFDTLSGDAHTVLAGGILAGGDDTIN